MIWIRAGTWCIQENAAGNQEPAAGQAASPPKKRMHLNVKDHTYMCCDHMSSEPPRMKCRLRHHLGTAPSLRVTKQRTRPPSCQQQQLESCGRGRSSCDDGQGPTCVPYRKLQWNCNCRHCGKVTNGVGKYYTASMFPYEALTVTLAANRDKHYQQKLTQSLTVYQALHMGKAGPSVLIRLRMYTAHTYAYRISGFCPYNAVRSIIPSIRNIRNCNIREHTAVMGKSCTPACLGVIKARHGRPQP